MEKRVTCVKVSVDGTEYEVAKIFNGLKGTVTGILYWDMEDNGYHILNIVGKQAVLNGREYTLSNPAQSDMFREQYLIMRRLDELDRN